MPNVLIPFYDDLDLLKRAVATVPEELTVYAVDGRYQHFPGDSSVTDGAAEWCAGVENVRYVEPPEGQRPWGADRPDLPPTLRYDQMAEARYVNYEVLPPGEWVLKMDTDERLQSLDLDVFDRLDPMLKYTPFVYADDSSRLYPHRVYVPENWTFWVDDVFFPREFYPRETPVDELARAQSETHHNRANHGGVLIDECVILNTEKERSPAYLRRRQAHLESMGQDERAAQVGAVAKRADGP